MVKKIDFLGGATNSLRTEFVEREKYKRLIKFDNMIDTLYDKHLYGFLNHNFEPVYLVNTSQILSNFPGVAEDIYCLNFVASAFSHFREDYLERINTTSKNFPPFLSGLTPIAGHEGFEEIYNSYISYSIIRYSSFLEDDTNIDDYNCFLTVLKSNFKDFLERFPITRSGFCLSRHNSVFTTGLVIELANLDYDSDIEKGEIVQSDDFTCYADYAQSAGFYVDKNSPWRIYADLEAPIMKARIKKASPDLENLEDLDFDPVSVISSLYRLKTSEDDLYDLQDFVLRTYNEIKKSVPFYRKTVYNNHGNKKTQKVFRPEINFLSSAEWLEMLLMVRLFELSAYEEEEFLLLKEEVLLAHKMYGTHHAIGKIAKIASDIIRRKLEK